jgi:hypothetical protein
MNLSGRTLSKATLATISVSLVCLVAADFAAAQGGAAPGGNNPQPAQPANNGRNGGQPGGQGGRGGGGGGLRGMFGGGGDPMAASIDSREIAQYAKTLNLSADQKDLAQTLFKGYEEQFRTKSEEMRTKLDEARQAARDSGDNSMWQSIGEQMNAFRVSRQKMEDQFFSDYKEILTPDQLTQWPTIERTRRREKTMGRGLMSGERMDVIKLVDDAKLPDDVKATLAPVLAQYEADLDRELVARNKVYDENVTKFMAAMRDPTQNHDGLQKAFDQGKDASTRVREINKRYARQVEALLPESEHAPWEKAVKAATFPDVYRPSGTSRQITAAEGFSDLDATQKEGIKALEASFTHDLDAVNDRLATTQEQQESTMTVDRMFARFGRGPGGQGGAGQGGGGANSDDPMADIRQQKRDLERKASDSLKKILTPDQADRLPQGGGNFGPGGQNNGGGNNQGNGGNNNRRRGRGGANGSNGGGGAG